MAGPITINVKMEDGVTVNVTNVEGWTSFFAGLLAMDGVCAEGMFLPRERILHITPAPPQPLQARPDPTQPNVVHLTPQAAPTPDAPQSA